MKWPGRQSIFSKEQWDWIAARYLEGYSCRELAAFTGFSAQSIAQKMCIMGIKRSGPPLPPLTARSAEFIALGREV